MKPVLDAARSDASLLVGAGFPSLMVENFGDVPFFADSVPPETIAAMTMAVSSVMEETGVPLGLNVLRNDALAAMGVAAATGARFIRVNVLVGVMYTDQGPIVGKAAELARKRTALGPEVEIWADVMVKHSTAPAGLEIGRAASDTVERGLADAIVVSGPGTGTQPDLEEVRSVRRSVPEETRLVIGSGADTTNLAALSQIADSVIVGTAVKHDGDPRSRVDAARAAEIVAAATESGLI